MFRNWGFLMGEMWGLILLAALLGLFAGWLIWGRRSQVNIEADGLRRDLEVCESACADRDGRIAALEADLTAANQSGDLQGELDDCIAGHDDKDRKIAELEAELAAAPRVETASAAPVAVAAAPATDGNLVDYDGDGIVEGKDEGQKPATLTAPREGGADDLKQIKGIGPKLEQLCNRLGFYHFDQIASWTGQEVAWVDANLEGFKGRVSRDDWVEQAKILAAGGQTEFSNRVKDGDVY